MGDKSTGLLPGGKYQVRRVDGTDAPGGKHEGCCTFVLDLTHDRHARLAALAYADSAERDGFFPLAADLRALVAEHGGGRDYVLYLGGDLTKPVSA